MTDSQPKDKANRGKAEAASEGVEERMARFEASTAEMQGTIGDLAAVIKRFMDQAEIKGQTYASTLIEAVETEFQQDKDEFDALVAPTSLLARLNTSPARAAQELTTVLPNQILHATSSTPGFPSAIQEENITRRSSSGRPTLRPNAPVRSTLLEHHAALPILAIPQENDLMLGESHHSTHTRLSQSSKEQQVFDTITNVSKVSAHSQAWAKKDLLDDKLDNAKIQAIDESVTFLTKYVRDSDNPEVVVRYVNLIRDQWTRRLELTNGIKRRSLKATGGNLSETGSQPEQDRHGTPLSARGLPITPWQKGGNKLVTDDHEDDDNPGDDDGNDPYGNTGGDYDDPDDFGFGHRVRQHPTVSHQPWVNFVFRLSRPGLHHGDRPAPVALHSSASVSSL
jgi:hypothetical protein